MNIIAAAHKLRPVNTPAIGSDLLDKQRKWLQAVLTAKRTSATELATSAGLSASTLTRFLNDPDHPHALAARTIEAIETATGIRAYDMPDEGPGGFAEADAIEYVAEQASSQLTRAVHAMIAGNPALVPWRLSTRALETIGYFPGDVIVVDLNARPRGGDAVCAQVYDWKRGRANTVMRVFHPPVLVAATLDPTAFEPLVVDDKAVAIKGVIVGMVRGRAAA